MGAGFSLLRPSPSRELQPLDEKSIPQLEKQLSQVQWKAKRDLRINCYPKRGKCLPRNPALVASGIAWRHGLL
jgi:hypothetical protein